MRVVVPPMSSTITGRSRALRVTRLVLSVMRDISGISISDDGRFCHGKQARDPQRRYAMQDGAGHAVPAQRAAQTRGVNTLARGGGHGRMLALDVIELHVRLVLADGTQAVLACRQRFRGAKIGAQASAEFGLVERYAVDLPEVAGRGAELPQVAVGVDRPRTEVEET